MAGVVGFLTASLDRFWNGLDLAVQTVIPERIRNILGLLQPLFNFTASKFVVIKDWRLGLILRVFQLAVAIYILQDIFTKASYLTTEVPSGVLSPFVSTGSRKEKVDALRQQESEAPNLPYCAEDGTYDFSYSGQNFSDFKCIYSEASALGKKGETQFFVTTYTTLSKTVFIKAERSACRTLRPDGYTNLLYLAGACGYVKSASYFPIKPEDGSLRLLHGFTTSSAIKRNQFLPETIVEYRNGTVKKFKEGEVVQFPISEWLQLAGIDLDKRMNDQDDYIPTEGVSGEGEYEGEFPITRLSGIGISVKLNYYQRKLAPHPWKKVGPAGRSNRHICLVDVTPVFGWTLQGSDVRHMIANPRSPIFLTTDGSSADDIEEGEVATIQADIQNFGIQFAFSAAGIMGKFSIRALIDAFVAGSVMLNVAQTIVVFIALYGMGLSSKLYMEFMRESVDWRKEYARFAAQALVAGYAFMGYDENNSFKLDRKEVFKTLKLILGQRLPEDKLAALADFVMRQGEEDSKVSKGVFRLEKGDVPATNLISIEEWIGIFTEEKVSLSALSRLIDNEYKDVRTREFLVRAAHGVRMRGLPGEGEGGQDDEEDDADDVDPEILAYQQNAKRQMTQAFLANTQQGPKGSSGPDVEGG